MHLDCNGLHCPVDTTLNLIGGKYKSLILWHLVNETLRHGQLQKLIPQATPKMLTQQLRELEKDNLLIRKAYPEVPPRVEYSLTDLGRSLEPILMAMYAWGTKYMEDNGCEISCSMVLK